MKVWDDAAGEVARRMAAERLLAQPMSTLSVVPGRTYAEEHGLVPPPRLSTVPVDPATERLLVTLMAAEVGGRLVQSAFRRGRKLLPPLKAFVEPYADDRAGDPESVREYLFRLQLRAFDLLAGNHHEMWVLTGELRRKGTLVAGDVWRCRHLMVRFDPRQQLGFSAFVAEMGEAGAVA